MRLKCSLCYRGDRPEIDRAIVEGASVRTIAGRHGTSKSAVDRHRAHVAEAMAKAAESPATAPPEAVALVAQVEAREKAAGPDLLTRLFDLTRETREILAEARRAKDRDVAIKALARLEKQLELEAKVLGQIREAQVNVAIVDPVGMLRAATLAAEERRAAVLPARPIVPALGEGTGEAAE